MSIMKKTIFAFLLTPFLMLGCLEDKSNKEIDRINPIVIDMGNVSSSLSVYMFDTLKVAPLVYKIGTPDAKLSYEWRLHSQYEQVDNFRGWVIDSTMSCAACITAPASPTEYYLKYTVTDEQTGIKNFLMFRLRVLSPFAEGLAVADTRDGKTSDVTLIIDRCFNSSIADKNNTKTYRNAWSEVNGSKIEGLVKGIMINSYSTNRAMTVISDKAYLRADYYDYVSIPGESNEKLFMVPPDDLWALDYRGSDYDAAIMQEIINLGGKIWPRGQQQNNRLYSYFMFPSGYPDYDVTHLLYLESPSRVGYGYDNKYKKLIFFDYNGSFYPVDQLTDGQNAFDVNDLSDYEPIYLGQTNTSTAQLLTRQKSTGKYIGLTISALGSAALKTSGTLGKATFDFSAAAEIANAKYFATNVIEDAIYYATDTRVYATSIYNIDSKVQWEAPAGEKITGLRVWKNYGRIDYEDHNPNSVTGFLSISTRNRMMLITTYNESTGEGKITAVPIVTLGIGGLEPNRAFHRVFGGFGRILTMCPQKN